MIMVIASLIGAGSVPPLVGFLADHFSFSFAFGAAGVGTLASLFLLGLLRFGSGQPNPSQMSSSVR